MKTFARPARQRLTLPLDFRARENLPFGLCWRLGVLTSVPEFVDRAADGDRRFAAKAGIHRNLVNGRFGP